MNEREALRQISLLVEQAAAGRDEYGVLHALISDIRWVLKQNQPPGIMRAKDARAALLGEDTGDAS